MVLISTDCWFVQLLLLSKQRKKAALEGNFLPLKSCSKSAAVEGIWVVWDTAMGSEGSIPEVAAGSPDVVPSLKLNASLWMQRHNLPTTVSFRNIHRIGKQDHILHGGRTANRFWPSAQAHFETGLRNISNQYVGFYLACRHYSTCILQMVLFFIQSELPLNRQTSTL